MKIKTSLTDIPFAVTSAETLSKIGYNLWETNSDIKKGLMNEGCIRNLVKKYDGSELIESYNNYVQKYIFPKLNISPDIHILDCTSIEKKSKKNNYEYAKTVKKDGEIKKGYKLGTLRGLLDDSGIIEETVFGSINIHDLKLTRNLLMTTKCLKPNDILIEDRGFLSRDIIKFLKNERKIDIYIPAKKNMDIYNEALSIAKMNNKWIKHPNAKRKTQEIQLVKNIGIFWESNDIKSDVEINACVVHDFEKEKYYVFMTTDLKKTARQIVKIYEVRTEIEEDYRQLKDFWKIEDFKSTKYNFIVFHIVMTLIGYMYFQIFKNTEEGEKYSGKSLPIILKNFKSEGKKDVVVYIGQYFGMLGFVEFLDIYAKCNENIKKKLRPVLEHA